MLFCRGRAMAAERLKPKRENIAKRINNQHDRILTGRSTGPTCRQKTAVAHKIEQSRPRKPASTPSFFHILHYLRGLGGRQALIGGQLVLHLATFRRLLHLRVRSEPRHPASAHVRPGRKQAANEEECSPMLGAELHNLTSVSISITNMRRAPHCSAPPTRSTDRLHEF